MTKPSKSSMKRAREIVDGDPRWTDKRTPVERIAKVLDLWKEERAHSAKLAGELDVMRSRASAHLIRSEGEGMRRYHIKYGNRLYLMISKDDFSWTHCIPYARSGTLKLMTERLAELKKDTGLYEARVVAESDIALTVENVP